jgi:SAM-dependent methyltransferase
MSSDPASAIVSGGSSPEPDHRNEEQEAFLQGFFLGMPPIRVLDFGCGFGRDLRNLATIPWLDLHGCDISHKRVDVARSESGLPEPDRRIQQIEAHARLPFDDDAFDLVFTNEVLIHVHPSELHAVLSELWRVSRSLLLHIENAEVRGSHRESNAQDGSWKHDLRTAYATFAGAEVKSLHSAIDLQTIYLVTKPTSSLGHAPASRAEAALDVARRSLRQTRLQLEDRGLRLSRAQIDLEDARHDLHELRWTPPSALGSFFKAGFEGLARRLKKQPASYRGFATAGSLEPEAFLAARPESISICHPDWRGIHAATHAQSRFVLEIPGIQDEEQCRRAVAFIAESGACKVVINGYPDHIDRLAIALMDAEPKIEVFLVYHGCPAQDHAREDRVIQRMLDLVDRGALRKLGFVKAGLAEYFQLSGYPAEHVTNRFSAPFLAASPSPRQGDRFHIGVFAPNISHKNVTTQILAGLMIPDSVVEVCELPPLEFLKRSHDRLQVHGILPHPEFMEVLRNVDASLYVSHSECYPMTVLESLAAGVVCLTSHTSELFSGSPILQQALVVPEHDNPSAIAGLLREALDRRTELIPLAQAHLEVLDAQATVRWQSFIDS